MFNVDAGKSDGNVDIFYLYSLLPFIHYHHNIQYISCNFITSFTIYICI